MHVGHAPHLLRYCVICPPYLEPRPFAKAKNDADQDVCLPHALETIPMLTEGN